MTIPGTIGHYRIIRQLGSGGMGEVFLAEDTRLGRQIAVKVLPAAMTGDPERRGRFEREARAVAALSHPNIVTIHSVEEHEGVVFLTMELVEGQTVTDLISAQGLTLDRVLKIAIPLADAVGAAHQKGITHRDLKPANIMVGEDGRVKVLDFGLAKLQEAAAGAYAATMATEQLTGDGRIMGTVAYMSPEQAEGRAVDSRSDIFSLGIVLFELATGRRPFGGDTNLSVLSAILKDPAPSVTDLRADLPRDFSRIIRRCLAKDPEERYQTAKDLRNDLKALKEDYDSAEVTRQAPPSGVNQVAAAPPPSATAVPAVRRSRVLVVIGGVLALAAAAAGTWYLRARQAPPASTGQMRLSRLTSSGQAGRAAISPDGRYVVHVVNSGSQRSLWMRQVTTTSNVQIVAPADDRFAGLSFSPDGDHVLFLSYPPGGRIGTVFTVPALGGTPQRLLDDADSIPAFSPDGKQIAFVRGDWETAYELLVAKADGSGARRVASRPAPNPFGPQRPAWSPDGSLLAIAVAGGSPFMPQYRVLALDVSKGETRWTSQATFGYVGELSWMPDGRSLVFDGIEAGVSIDQPRQVWHLSYPDGAVSRLTNDLNNYFTLSVTANGRQATSVQGEDRAGLWTASDGDRTGGRTVTPVGVGKDGTYGLAWTPDGRLVYTSASGGSWDLWIAHADGRDAKPLTTDRAAEVEPAVSADGRWVAYTSDKSGQPEIWVMGIDGSNPRQVTTAGGVSPMFIGPRDPIAFLAVAGKSVEMRQVPLAGGPPSVLVPDAAKVAPELQLHGISRDGRLGVGHYTTPDQRGRKTVVVSLDGSAPPHYLPWTTELVAFAPDGRSLTDVVQKDNEWLLMKVPFDGTAQTPLKSLGTERAFFASYSPDGKTLAMSRGERSSDVVLLTAEAAR